MTWQFVLGNALSGVLCFGIGFAANDIGTPGVHSTELATPAVEIDLGPRTPEELSANIDVLTLEALSSNYNAAQIVMRRKDKLTVEEVQKAEDELHAANAFMRAAIRQASNSR